MESSLKNVKTNRILSLLGILGGVVFSVGDALLFLTPDYSPAENAGINYWQDMPMWRFGLSGVLGILGMLLLLCGVTAMYHAVRQRYGKAVQRWWPIGGLATVLTSLGHYLVGVWEPMQYKAMLATGLTADQFTAVIAAQRGWVDAMTYIVIALLMVQLAAYVYIILSGKLGAPRWMAVLGCDIALLGYPLCALLMHTGLQGLCSGLESLGEGLMYAAAYLYWKRKTAKIRQAETDFCG
ncbi:MAG: hypothetical protein PHE09_19195 [Oscillospiraceae bacterium]|nr:hypothetical protein [Oscillospiraceae bacterium]